MSEVTDNGVRPTKSTLPAHKQYTYYFEDWLTMYDTLEGEREVKDQGTTYLPQTKGMSINPDGATEYEKYKFRASFPEYTGETALGMYGLFWQKLPQIKANKTCEDWMKNATIDGKSFIEAYRETVDNVIKKGRYGILVDMDDNAESLDKSKNEDYPQLVPYIAESIVNWHKTIYKGKIIVDKILLDESYFDLNNDTFEYELKTRWRLCGLHTKDNNGVDLKKPEYYTVYKEGDIKDKYGKCILTFDYKYQDKNLTYPNFRGKKLDYIPFVFFNVTDLNTDIQKPPLLKIANLCLSAYRVDSDLKQGAYKTTLATLVGTGVDVQTEIAVGSDTAITVESDKAKFAYLEISGAGLTILKDMVTDIKKEAKEMGIQLAQKSSGDETGTSVEKHINVQTSTLKSTSTTTALGMLTLINIVNDWIGNKFGESNIVPSQEFSSTSVNADAMFKIYSAYKEGAMTSKDYYEYQKQNDYTSIATFDEWLVEMKKRDKELEIKQDKETEIKNKQAIIKKEQPKENKINSKVADKKEIEVKE